MRGFEPENHGLSLQGFSCVGDLHGRRVATPTNTASAQPTGAQIQMPLSR